MKKAPRPVLGSLSDVELAHILAQVDRSTPLGERDYLFVALLYDTGARIQELLNLAPCDIQSAPPPFVRLVGKGQRERLTPLLPQTKHYGLRSSRIRPGQAHENGVAEQARFRTKTAIEQAVLLRPRRLRR